MKIRVCDVAAAAKELHFEEPTSELTELLSAPVHDFQLPSPLAVRVTHYRAGADLFFQGHADGRVIGRCSRCLEEYSFDLSFDFSFVFSPHTERGMDAEQEDDALTYYDADEVDLTPPLRERILLALPTRPLCTEACAGLCPRCGASLNDTRCGCPTAEDRSPDPRFAVLRTLKPRSSP